ncbi:MAG: PAS domain S-box protein, partial [Cytophagales bacterium]|nr:PAS domain S-box protein [Cytophagales bacterium]
YLEKESLRLKEVPDNYVKIGSGLGEARPKCVVLVPVCQEESVLGVIELASFKEIRPFQLELVEKTGDMLASVIATLNANQKMKHLLEESQLMTEQMRAQEEEMRQNLEEMQVSQEEFERQRGQSEAFFNAIEKSVPYVLIDRRGKILQVNERFEVYSGYNSAQLVGQSREMFIHKEGLELMNYEHIWQKVSQDGSVEQLSTRRIGEEEVERIQFKYTGLFNRNNQLEKILCVVTETQKQHA